MITLDTLVNDARKKYCCRMDKYHHVAIFFPADWKGKDRFRRE